MSTISSGTTLTTALVQTGDTTGDLVIKTGSSNTTAMTVSGANQSVTFAGAVNVASSAFANGSAAAPSITFTGDTNTGIFSPGADSIGFAEGGAEVARFDSNGNLGIGTSSPTARLDVTGSSFATANVNFAQRTDDTTVSTATTWSSSSGNWMTRNNGGALTFNSGNTIGSSVGTERMRIDSSGNLGIGTSSPSSFGNLAIVSPSGGATLAIRNFGGAIQTAAIRFSQNGSGGDTRIQSEVANDNLQFLTVGTERMRITAAGGVAFNGASNFGSSGQLLQSNGDAAPTWVTPTVNGTARAWVNFNGSGGGIRASFNVTSISVNGTGRYTVNMTTALADANYSRVVAASGLSGDGNGVCANTDVVSGNSVTATTTAFGILLTISGQSGYRDSPFVSAAVFR